MGSLAAVFIVLMLTRVGVAVRYDETGLEAVARLGLIHIRIFPFKEKEQKEKPKRKKEPPKAEPQRKKQKGGNLQLFKDMLSDLLRIGGSMLRGIRIDLLELDCTLAAEDPYQTAMMFGGGSAAMGLILPMIENTFMVKKKSISIKADFDTDKPLIICAAAISVRIGKMLVIGLRLAAAYIKARMKEHNAVTQ